MSKTLLLNSDLSKKRMCVVATLKEYLTRTQSLQGLESQLFISYKRPFRRVSRETISHWVKLVLTDAGIDTSKFKPLSSRAASTFEASNTSVMIFCIQLGGPQSLHSQSLITSLLLRRTHLLIRYLAL